MLAEVQDRPPRLRFELTSKPDKILSEQTGREEFMNVINVMISPYGDLKTEVPDVAMETAYRQFTKRVDVVRKIPRYIENKETGKIDEIIEDVTFQEDRNFYEPEVIFPWIKKLEDRLHHGRISPNYLDYCKKAFEAFRTQQEMPVNGYALINWKGIDPAIRDRLLGMGLNTVELVAEMTEEAIGYIGMGARAAKDKASAFLKANSSPEKVVLEMTKMQSEMAKRDEQISALQAKMMEILEQKEQANEIDNLRAMYKEKTSKTPDMRWGKQKLYEMIDAAA